MWNIFLLISTYVYCLYLYNEMKGKQKKENDFELKSLPYVYCLLCETFPLVSIVALKESLLSF